MNQRNDYPAGVPCWVETFQTDVDAALSFYTAVFGWQPAGPGDLSGDGAGGRYYVARLRGLDVAGISSQPVPGAPTSWLTSVAVADVDEAVKAVTRAGGTVVATPFDTPPVGRAAVVADPGGAVHGLWEGSARAGAQLVNEPGAWSMSQLATPDTSRAAAFYADAYGWTTETLGAGDGAATLFRLPGYVGGVPQEPVSREVVAVMVAGPGPAQWTPNFWVPDADAAESTAAGLGGRTLVPGVPGPAGKTVVLADPQGAVFSVTGVDHRA
ncbi:VOC family protein [Arthrobacter sp. A2-55]|uniref:VOC family protein n=1 Tax=Arthrobacter sp. A2-55 TaxID=2897337 RepID=UPI0021CD508A|nr:VOC family protein [Arthrobacter sp. A2-55]MCU6479865.1 VOC family protein [Arthrobacter sp. A2-55]